MKKITILSLGLFALTACNNNPKNASSEHVDEQTAIERPIGGDKDDHGCLVGAGETWSELKQSCVQIFNIGQRLNPIETKEGEAVFSAFVLFNDDQSKVELFLPGNDQTTTILDRSAGDSYQNDVYKYDTKETTLYIDGEKKYSAQN